MTGQHGARAAGAAAIRDGGGAASRPVAAGRDWRLSEYICLAGPGDRPFEERHDQVSIAAVIEGSFNYHGETGRAVLHPGALLLGNVGRCYQCGHDHGRGDRCISLNVAPDLFAEVAASVAGSGRFAFPVARLPALPTLLPWLARIEAWAARRRDVRTDTARGEAARIEELVPAYVAAVVGAVSGERGPGLRFSARDERRVREALRHIELHADTPLDLDGLAGIAGMSKFHFLRVFRRVVGLTPYQFLLGLRLRRAALRLATTAEPVAGIAYEAGFGDLSTFNNRFRATFGESPRGYRRREGPT